MSSIFGGKSGSSGGSGGGQLGSTGGKSAKSGGPLIPLYGVVIHDCIRRGDTDEMSTLLGEARRQYNDLGSAIKDLEKASSTGKY